MPKPTPFHARIQPLCESYDWSIWAGQYAVRAFDVCHEREYNAFRQATGVIDVSPLFKYDIRGPDAAQYLSWITVRDLSTLKVGRSTYLCWTDEQGKVIDDGTCSRIAEGHYRLTAAAPMHHWFTDNARGYTVTIEDVSERYAALAIQGPTSRDVLRSISRDIDVDGMRFFGVQEGMLAGIPAVVTRTGYTGDLGYELWVEQHHALTVWDALFESGDRFGIHPAGLNALDVCRIEAGFLMMGVDYTGAFDALIESQKSTPDELGLGWMVKLERSPFIGQSALRDERKSGPSVSTVGLEIDWVALEELYGRHGLPAALPATAWRDSVPLYKSSRQVGRATSGSWSPILKKNLALARVDSRHSKLGTCLDIEVTVEWARATVPARVVKTPFYDPPQKKAVDSNV